MYLLSPGWETWGLLFLPSLLQGGSVCCDRVLDVEMEEPGVSLLYTTKHSPKVTLLLVQKGP